MATRAMFRVEKRGDSKGDLLIVFPDDEANPGMVQFFSPRDGHGEASIRWVQSETRPARAGEFEELKRSYERRLGSTLTVAQRRSARHRRRGASRDNGNVPTGRGFAEIQQGVRRYARRVYGPDVEVATAIPVGRGEWEFYVRYPRGRAFRVRAPHRTIFPQD